MYSFNHIITGGYTSCLKDLLWICQYMETTNQLIFIRVFLITMFTLLCLLCRTAVLLLVPPAESGGALGLGSTLRSTDVWGCGFCSFCSCCVLALRFCFSSWRGFPHFSSVICACKLKAFFQFLLN